MNPRNWYDLFSLFFSLFLLMTISLYCSSFKDFVCSFELTSKYDILPLEISKNLDMCEFLDSNIIVGSISFQGFRNLNEFLDYVTSDRTENVEVDVVSYDCRLRCERFSGIN
uniref:Uncharacterized protein n=1 Tax=Opuntia streptacantha TaxID=393608 RepID=A0A7C9DYD8_OPUST